MDYINQLSGSDILSSIISFILGIIGGLIVSKIIERKEFKKKQKVLEIWNNLIQDIGSQNVFKTTNLSIDVIPWFTINDKNEELWDENKCNFLLENENQIEFPKDLDDIIKNNWKSEKTLNSKLFNENRYGLKDIYLNNSGNPTLIFHKTNYKNFIGTNKNYQKFDIDKLDKWHPLEINETEGFRLLKNSSFSNDLATSCNVITKDNKILLSKRSKKVHILPGQMHTSIAEGMNDNDLVSGLPNPFNTIARGAKDEIGIDIDRKKIKILAIGNYLPFSQPYIACELRLDMTYEELIKVDGYTKDSWEGNIKVCEFNVESLFPLISSNFEDDGILVSDIARHNIILSLIKEFGRNKIESKINLLNKYK